MAVEIGPEAIEKCVKEVGMGFMFAPRFHPGDGESFTGEKILEKLEPRLTC